MTVRARKKDRIKKQEKRKEKNNTKGEKRKTKKQNKTKGLPILLLHSTLTMVHEHSCLISLKKYKKKKLVLRYY